MNPTRSCSGCLTGPYYIPSPLGFRRVREPAESGTRLQNQYSVPRHFRRVRRLFSPNPGNCNPEGGPSPFPSVGTGLRGDRTPFTDLEAPHNQGGPPGPPIKEGPRTSLTPSYLRRYMKASIGLSKWRGYRPAATSSRVAGAGSLQRLSQRREHSRFSTHRITAHARIRPVGALELNGGFSRRPF